MTTILIFIQLNQRLSNILRSNYSPYHSLKRIQSMILLPRVLTAFLLLMVHSLVFSEKKICSYFADNISNHLDGEQREELLDCLYEHKDVSVTPENLNLGLTTEVEHVSHLKPDAKSLHQRPNRLSPDKKQVLHHHLDELISQGIIIPVSPDESLPITSPIGLVAKRNKL